jgi:N,N'-diacetyllegionaminate synthase
MKNIKINEKTIGNNSPIFIIAEAGVNDNGQLEISKKLVDVAVEAGADAIKFQTINPDKLVTRNAGMAEYARNNMGKNETHYQMLKDIVMKFEDFKELKRYCDEKGIIFLSTPYSEDAVDFLNPLVPAFKIGSSDINNLRLLRKIARLGKPMILGTGMSNFEEVKEALETIYAQGNNQVVLLHCTTDYPCSLNEINFGAMQKMQKNLDCLIGYSDHTSGIDVPLMAKKLGAVLIEKHFTLSREMIGPDHKASLEPEELKKMVKLLREDSCQIEIPLVVMGDNEKNPTPSEKIIMEIARKSIVSDRPIKKGKILEDSDLVVKRPGTGLNPKLIDFIVGKIAKRDIQEDELISLEDLCISRKIAIITGSRSDYGYLRQLGMEIIKNPELKLSLIATGTHFFEESGYSVNLVKEDFPDLIEAPVFIQPKNGYEHAIYVSKTIEAISNVFDKLNPDFCILIGDRSETFAAAQAAAFMSIPIAHLQGGDISSNIDDSLRHSITKLSHIHFPATENSANRLLKMGEDPKRIYLVGSTTIHEMINMKTLDRFDLSKKFNLDPKKPFLLLIQHPVTNQENESKNQLKTTLDAIIESGMQYLMIYPNLDPGSGEMINLIEEYKKNKDLNCFANLDREVYLSLLKECAVLIGNSSSGIIEAASFKIPVINIGDRQKNRDRGLNVIDVPHEKKKILEAIKFVLYDQDFKERLKFCKNPYESDQTVKKIIEIIKNTNITPELLQKRLIY